jgi:hypothetical protein
VRTEIPLLVKPGTDYGDAVCLRDSRGEDAEAIAAIHADSWRRRYRGAFQDAYLDGDILAERVAVWHKRLAERHTDCFTASAGVVGEGRPNGILANAAASNVALLPICPSSHHYLSGVAIRQPLGLDSGNAAGAFFETATCGKLCRNVYGPDSRIF